MHDAMKYLAMLLAVVAVCAGEDAFPGPVPTPHSVSGVVLDTTGAAIVGADVILKQQDTELSRTRSDSGGAFYFDGINPGSYQLVVQAPGFRETTTALSLGPKPASNVRIILPVFVASEEVGVEAGTSIPQVGTDIAQNQSANT